MVVSPSGDVMAPNAPLANTAPTVSGIDAPVAAANDTPNGINNPHVPQEEPIKYPTTEPRRNIDAGVKNAGKKADRKSVV